MKHVRVDVHMYVDEKSNTNGSARFTINLCFLFMYSLSSANTRLNYNSICCRVSINNFVFLLFYYFFRLLFVAILYRFNNGPGEELFFAYYRSEACWDRWHRLTGSLAGAAHLSHDNAGVLRSDQVGQKPTVEKKVKSQLKLQ